MRFSLMSVGPIPGVHRRLFPIARFPRFLKNPLWSCHCPNPPRALTPAGLLASPRFLSFTQHACLILSVTGANSPIVRSALPGPIANYAGPPSSFLACDVFYGLRIPMAPPFFPGVSWPQAGLSPFLARPPESSVFLHTDLAVTPFTV